MVAPNPNHRQTALRSAAQSVGLVDKEPTREQLRALELLDDPIVMDAYSLIESSYLARLKQLGPKDDLERFKLVEAIKMIEIVQAHIRNVANGKAPSSRAIRKVTS